MVPHPVDPSILIALKWVSNYTEYPMKITRNGGATWENFGPKASSDWGEDYMLRALYIDPNNPKIMIGAGLSCGTCFRSSDGGNTWIKVLNGNIYGTEADNNVRLLTSPANTSTVYLNRYVLMKSSDNGLSWIAASPTGRDGDWRQIGWLSQKQPGLFLFFDKGVGRFRSTDYGENWIYQPYPDLNIRPSNLTLTESIDTHEIYYIEGYGCSNYSSPRFVKSRDSGLTWEQKQPELMGLLSYVNCSVNLDQRLYGIVDNGNTNLEENRSWLAVSDNGGDSFREMQLPGAIRVHDICDQPGNPDVWYVLGIHEDNDVARVYKTIDGGTTWISIGNESGLIWTGRKEFPFTKYGLIKIDPQHTNTIYVLWGGLWKSIDEGIQWKQKSTFSSEPVKICFFIDPFKSDWLYLSYKVDHSHSIRSVDAGETWSDSDLWPPCISKPQEPSEMVYSLQTMQKMKISTSPPIINLSGYGTTVLKNSESGEIQLIGWGMDHDINDTATGVFLFWQDTYTGCSFNDENPEGSGLFISVIQVSVEEAGCLLLEMRAMDRFGLLSSASSFLKVH